MIKGDTDIADAAYLASRAESYEKCLEMDEGHEWDILVQDMGLGGRDREGGSYVGRAVNRINEKLLVDKHIRLGDHKKHPCQKAITKDSGSGSMEEVGSEG